jgi:hypothetical protein
MVVYVDFRSDGAQIRIPENTICRQRPEDLDPGRCCPGKYNDVSRAAAAGPQPGKKNSEEDHPDGRLLPELIIFLPTHSYRSTPEKFLTVST